MYSRSVKDVWLTSGRARIKFNSSCLGVGSILAISEFEMVVRIRLHCLVWLNFVVHKSLGASGSNMY